MAYKMIQVDKRILCQKGLLGNKTKGKKRKEKWSGWIEMGRKNLKPNRDFIVM